MDVGGYNGKAGNWTGKVLALWGGIFLAGKGSENWKCGRMKF
jgi:hypothetical protein